ncbi:MAG: ABC transporter permease [Anaerolineae bacterium]|jgi:peptide/nickel transport system permease protein
MVRFIFRRVVRGLVALLLFQSLLFALVHALPYDFSSIVLSGPAHRRLIRSILGLDLPLWQQYGRWLFDFVRLDLGQSYLFWPTPVVDILGANLPRTLLLFLSGAVLAYALGIWLGKVLAWRRGSLLELGTTLGGVAAYTSFAPFLGFVLIMVFGRELQWFSYQRFVDHNVWFDAPVTVDWLLVRLIATALLLSAGAFLLWLLTRAVKPRARRWSIRLAGLLAVGAVAGWTWYQSGVGYLAVDLLYHLALPLATVILLSFGETMMLMRMAMLETMGEEYVLTARAIGYSEKTIRDKHVARNAILPVLTRLALNLPFVLVGSLVVERVFLWTAMGQVVFNAVEYYDVPLLLGILSVVGVLTLIAHIVLDVVYVYLDPRLRYAPGS